MYSFGENSYGQLGTGDTNDRRVPTKIDFFEDADIFYLSAGKHHAALIDEHLRVFIWGSNKHGQIGNSQKDLFFKEPQLVQTSFESVKVKCGYRNTLVLTREGDVWGCGHNKGGTIFSSHELSIAEFTKISELSDIEKIFCTNFFTAIGRDQSLYMWGADEIWRSNRPCIVSEFEGSILEVATGDNFLVIIDTGLLMYSMGLNQKGQLGFGEVIQADDFVCIEKLSNHPIKNIACGRDFCLGIGGILQPNQGKQLLQEKRSVIELKKSSNDRSEMRNNIKHVHYIEENETINDNYINEEDHSSNYISNPKHRPMIKDEIESRAMTNERLSIPDNVKKIFNRDQHSRLSSIKSPNNMQKSTGFMSTNFHQENDINQMKRSYQIKNSKSTHAMFDTSRKNQEKQEQENQEVFDEFISFQQKYNDLVTPPDFAAQYMYIIDQMRVS